MLLSDLFILRGVPGHIRSDNGPEFIAKAVQDWIAAVGARTAYIERGSPWENGFIESFNARLRDELLDGEIFYTLREAQIVIESWRRHYNAVRPHASIGYQRSRPGGVRAGTRRMAGCATPTSSAGHAPAGAKTSPKLTNQTSNPPSGCDGRDVPIYASAMVIRVPDAWLGSYFRPHETTTSDDQPHAAIGTNSHYHRRTGCRM